MFNVLRCGLLIFIVGSAAQLAWGDAIERMKLENLRTTRASLEALRDERQEIQRPESEFRDYRAQIHVHSHFSHDSEGSIDEILEAAKKCNTHVIMFSDHASPEHDYVVDGYRGLRDGVLLVPGYEKDGFLLFPKASIHGKSFASPQELADRVTTDGGLAFVSHLEERLDWDIHASTGNEIYNTHFDAMSEPKLLAAMRNPVSLLGMLPGLQQFPQELFGAIHDYPQLYLQRWDQLCQTAPRTGVSANDAHHNQVVRGIVTEDKQLVVEDVFGKPVAKLDPEKVPLVKLLTGARKEGDKVFEVDLDPYERSFGHVSTHLLMRDQREDEVWDALKSGRAYVGFEWLADPTGFGFEARRGDQRWPMGSQVELKSDSQQAFEFVAETPLPVLFKLIRNGGVVQEHRGRSFTAAANAPGVYRLEAWLQVAGELKIWILSNPIYVK